MLQLQRMIPFPDLQVDVYRDDSNWLTFYPIPTTPRIRRNAKGHPVFLLTKYAFSDSDRENNPDLPMGGGYINMDVEFGLTAEQEAEVRVRLQKMVNEQWLRWKNIFRINNNSEFKAPPVVLASPQWTDGNVKFDVVDDENLIKGVVSEGKPSLMTNNSAVFNATLTPAGATFFQRTLVNEDGSGIDLTPIQVSYDLTFLRRIPPAEIRIEGYIEDVYETFSEIDHEHNESGIWWWKEHDYETREKYTEELTNTESVTIDFDRSEFEEEDVKELEGFAMSQLASWLENNLFERISPADPSYPDAADVYGKKSDIYRLKEIEQVVESEIDIRITKTALAPHTIHPNSTLEAFFSDMSEDEIAQHVREVDLEDDFFNTLDLQVKAYADYAEIAYVQVDVEYPNGDAPKPQPFTFKSNDDEAKYWNPRLNSNGDREYRYRYEVSFKSNPDKKYITEWEYTTSKQLNINVGRPGELNINVLAGQIDWSDLVEQVQVSLSYEDSVNDIEKEVFPCTITQDNPSVNYRRWIYEDRNKPLTYQATYFLKNGQQIETEETVLEGDTLILNDSFIDTLEVIVVPASKFTDVSQVLLELRYTDDSGYNSYKPFSITKPDFFSTWRVPLIDANQKDWEWKQTTIYTDGSRESTSWREELGSQSLIVSWPTPPSIDVSINSALVKFDKAEAIEVAMTYKGNVVEGESPAVFIFEGKGKQSWSVKVENDDIKDYDWEVTYHLEDESLTLTGTSDRNRFLIPRIPKPAE